MNSFIQYVLYELRDSLGFVILAGVFGALAIGCANLVFRKKYKGERKFPWGKIFLTLILAGYLLFVLSVTILRKQSGFHREYNLHFFRAWREAWNNFSVKNWANVLLNVALFTPLGVLLPLIWRKCRKWYVTIPIGFATSFAIELIQLTISRGICDVDDLFANTLGTVLGFCCIMAILSLFNIKGRKLKPCLLYSGITLIHILAICGIFISYHFQVYGNLPQAAAYTNDTKGVKWTLECELPEIEAEVAVYQTQTRSKMECDAFADNFKQIINTEYNTVSYYQEAAYYMDNGGDGGAHFLHVNYLDQGYEYSAHFNDDVAWGILDRTAVEMALAKYPVQLPTSAEFTVEEDGWYSFTAHQHIDGAMLFDGTLRVRITQDGNIRELRNQLLSYRYYDRVEVITPREAFARLKAGKFNDDGYLEHIQPTDVSVTECALEYKVDTKGFYQPVYIFHLKSYDDSYKDSIIIPAMK